MSHEREDRVVREWDTEAGRKLLTLLPTSSLKRWDASGWVDLGTTEGDFKVAFGVLVELLIRFAKRHDELQRFHRAIDALREIFVEQVQNQIDNLDGKIG